MKRNWKPVALAAVLSASVALPALAQGMGQGMGQGQGMVMQDCAKEMHELCGNMQHGQGAMPQCLQDHKDKLSDACKKALESHGAMGQGMGPGHGYMQPKK